MELNLTPFLAAGVIAVPIFWLFAEFKAKRTLRIILGILSLISMCFMASIVGKLERFNYNAWYGTETAKLLEVSIDGLESGKTRIVLDNWRELSNEYKPNYQNKANYDELVKKYVAEIEEEMKK